jgi:uncharacterized protein involved in tolerance to divalent cations
MTAETRKRRIRSDANISASPAARVNIRPTESIYVWEGKLEEAQRW